jgi:hypothetical protein
MKKRGMEGASKYRIHPGKRGKGNGNEGGLERGRRKKMMREDEEEGRGGKEGKALCCRDKPQENSQGRDLRQCLPQ